MAIVFKRKKLMISKKAKIIQEVQRKTTCVIVKWHNVTIQTHSLASNIG
jgi:hypothetical protein